MGVRATALWAVSLSLALNACAAQAAPAIDIFGTEPNTGLTDFGKCQDSVVPGGPPLRISIFVRLGGLNGISGAELFVREHGPAGNRIRVFEPVASGGLGWQVFVFPNPAAATTIGNPFTPTGTPPDTQERYSIAFAVTGPSPSEGCQVGDADAPPGYVRLVDASISAPATGSPIPPDTYFRIEEGEPPSGSNIVCPQVNLCDVPIFTRVCVGTATFPFVSGEFIVNPTTRTCTVATTLRAWSEVKALYR